MGTVGDTKELIPDTISSNPNRFRCIDLKSLTKYLLCWPMLLLAQQSVYYFD